MLWIAMRRWKAPARSHWDRLLSIAVLAVACSRCEWARRYSMDTPIARHGEGFGIPKLLRLPRARIR